MNTATLAAEGEKISLRKLKAEHLLARQRLNDAHDPFIQKMPLNIIIKVLLMDKQSNYGDDRTVDTARPLRLASVSRSWRSVTFAIPQLWTTMWMHRHQPCWAFPRSLVKEWLARSGTLPLRIGLTWVTTLEQDPFLPLRQIGQVLKLIHQQEDRLESLQLNIPADVLDTFELEDAPLLRIYALTVRRLDLDADNLNFGALTEVSIKESFDKLETFEFFRMCPKLQRCELWVQQMHDPDHETLPKRPIILPHLEYLRLELLMESPEDIPRFLCVPQLRELHLIMLQSRFDAPPYAAMIKRSKCALRSFTYENDWMEADEDLAPLLQAAPTLHTLCFKVDNKFSTGPHDLYGPLFGRLARPPSANTGSDTQAEALFLPNLQNLLYEGPLPFTWTQYADFCEAHAQNCLSPIKLGLVELTITRCDDTIDEDTRSRLKALPRRTRDVVRLEPREAWDTPSPTSVE